MWFDRPGTAFLQGVQDPGIQSLRVRNQNFVADLVGRV